jgi:cytochrome c oxidase assembly protein subunit 11
MKNQNLSPWQSNKKIFSISLIVVLIMLLLTAASVPIYKIYCKVTGLGGTVRVYQNPSSKIGKKKFIIHFDSSVDSKLDWKFSPEQKLLELITGENKLAFYSAENKTNKVINGIAVYNVTPFLAGKYFNKVECFCFEKQTLKPHEKALMPVLFHISPEIEDDPNLKDLQEITLSYTFYKLEE